MIDPLILGEPPLRENRPATLRSPPALLPPSLFWKGSPEAGERYLRSHRPPSPVALAPVSCPELPTPCSMRCARSAGTRRGSLILRGSSRKNEMPSDRTPAPYLQHLLGFSSANEPGCMHRS